MTAMFPIASSRETGTVPTPRMASEKRSAWRLNWSTRSNAMVSLGVSSRLGRGPDDPHPFLASAVFGEPAVDPGEQERRQRERCGIDQERGVASEDRRDDPAESRAAA